MDKDQAIQLLTNLQHDYQSYADAFAQAILALQGTIVIVDTAKQAEIDTLQTELDTANAANAVSTTPPTNETPA